MVLSSTFLLLSTGLTLVWAIIPSYNDIHTRASDPCAAIGGKKWVSPKEVRTCFSSIRVNQDLKTNVRGLEANDSFLHTHLDTYVTFR